ncbi:MAG: hypothetical protein L6R39_003484 [Caloplaca ligustica]|nr:MAG: hypothetical protein L6R39_003484 [Caloplaca ligustica]
MDLLNKLPSKKPVGSRSVQIPSSGFNNSFGRISQSYQPIKNQTAQRNEQQAHLLRRDSTPVHAGVPRGGGLGDGSLSIRGLHDPISTPSSANSKRNSSFVNLVSSDEEDAYVENTPKKPRRSVTESSPPESRHYAQDASAGTSVQRGSVQTLARVEIPVRESGGIVPTNPRDVARRQQFLTNLAQLRGPKVTVINEIDQSSPSTAFRFVNDNVLGPGVSRAPNEVMIGCTCPQDKRKIGCEYLYCDCLDDSAENEDGKKVFPYSNAKKNRGCLREFYLESRHHIYECNKHCNCPDNCKNRKVQHGRLVELEIFKTTNRGWGLRCPVDLRKGDFIDTYRGEIITVEESNARGDLRSADEENYFMSFDKFTEPEAITKTEFLEKFPDKVGWHAKKVHEGDWTVHEKAGEDMWLNPDYVPFLYVCDGMYVGGPTRFMNHSCDPNCRLFTVSYNHSDPHIYELALFALVPIPAGTELTFDYKDEDDRSVITHEQALEVQGRDGYMPQKCLCGTAECRQCANSLASDTEMSVAGTPNHGEGVDDL